MRTLSETRPATIVALGNGAYHYNFDTREVTSSPSHAGAEDGGEAEKEPATMYEYDTIEVWGRPTYQSLVRDVIRANVSDSEEFNLVNDYNAAKEGLTTGEEAERAVSAYREHLRCVAEVKEMVRADLEAAGYTDGTRE